MIVVHLAGVRHDRNLKALSECRDFARLTDTAYAVGIELNVIKRIALQQLAEAEDGELVLSASNWNAAITL